MTTYKIRTGMKKRLLAHTVMDMKKKIIFLTLAAVVLSLLFCAFEIDKNSSLKNLTHPYINTYECTQARLGEKDFLSDFDYIRIVLQDQKKLEVSFKRKKGSPHRYQSTYQVDDETGELSAEIGILGFKYRQSAKIEGGKFTLSLPILQKQLIMNFAAK